MQKTNIMFLLLMLTLDTSELVSPTAPLLNTHPMQTQPKSSIFQNRVHPSLL